ncbi:MAG TPA: von Willebrand factor type A domain-containing protein [Vicinamibacterales bacterium]|nr:von Willebrand factor type A domain-containing protein [Vicinamibacterales bacterium]
MFRRSIVFALSLIVCSLMVAAPRSAAVDLPAQPGQSAGVLINGTVVDGSLSPLAGVVITLNRQGATIARTTSDSAGRFRFEGVAPGDYEVKATHTTAPALVRTIRIGANSTTVQLPLVLASPVKASDAKEEAAGLTSRGVMPPPAPPPTTAPVAAPPIQGVIAGGAAGGRGGGVNDQFRQYNSSEAIYPPYQESRDRYDGVEPNRFKNTLEHPLSTFGADVDTASYVNVRRFISNGQLPPTDAVRVEDFLNYFKPDYTQPRARQPLALTTEIGDCPWAPGHKLVLVGARARTASAETREGRNIVLLLDVSGSMAPADRLPLIKTALGLFVDTLNPDDRLAIVTYAGSSGVALPSTPVRRRDVIQRAIANLNAGGSTNGAQGIVTAYRIARETYIPGGVNRVMLATDGDFNVGVTREGDLVRLIERERESGVFLSIFGVGTGNLNDSALEKIANKGNGHYVYLDSLQEARRVLLHETDAVLETVAKDVKFQVEFNPANVAAWKLIGYENRLMAARDFNDDRKDGGEMGAGHTVTVLYEVVPAGVEFREDGRVEGRPVIDELKYQPQPQAAVRVARPEPGPQSNSRDWLTVKARFKQPEGEVSALIEETVRPGGRVRHLPFATAVAEFGLLLRDSVGDTERWASLSRRLAAAPVGESLASDKAAFVELVDTAKGLARLQRRR